MHDAKRVESQKALEPQEFVWNLHVRSLLTKLGRMKQNGIQMKQRKKKTGDSNKRNYCQKKRLEEK